MYNPRVKVRKLLALAFAALFIAPPIFFHVCCSPPPKESYPAAAKIGGLPARVIVFGDTRNKSALEVWADDNEIERNVVVAGVVAENPALVINSGDLVLEGASATEWALFDRENRPIRDKGIPYYPALGNHEYRGRNDLAMENYFERFPALRRAKWYAIEAAHTRFLVLDSNFESLSAEELAAQDLWLDRELAASKANDAVKFVIIVCHHPPYTNSKAHRPDEGVQRRFVERMKSFPKAKALFAGHVHTIERFEVDGRAFVNSGGGGAPLTKVKTSETKWKDLYPGGEKRRFNYCLLTLREGGIDVEIKELDEANVFQLRDKFTIE